MNNKDKKTALITGASSGIGLAFAKEFARHGFNLVLVARREEKLKAIGAELERIHGVGVVSFAVDLSHADAVETITRLLAEEEIRIDALVNDAGFGINQGFPDADWPEHARSLEVMLTGYTRLCYSLAGPMREQSYGRIVNVASLAAFLPPSAGSLYSAIKSYIVHLSVALDLELRPFGVYCTAVCPGFTTSEFHDVMNVRKTVDKFPGLLWMTAEKVAHQGYDAVMKGKPVIINGWLNKLIAIAAGLIPRTLLYRILRHGKSWETD